ncbi:MAG: hypothetical protein HRU30_07155, partial [Rhodobacteraceae bacterium]|nr:hypothetical protein [Paracoccaceae bacterium]
TFLVSGWLALMAGAPAVGKAIVREGCSFHMPAMAQSPMRDLSTRLLSQGSARSPHWAQITEDAFDAETAEMLQVAQETCDDFEAFFASFARCADIAG